MAVIVTTTSTSKVFFQHDDNLGSVSEQAIVVTPYMDSFLLEQIDRSIHIQRVYLPEFISLLQKLHREEPIED